MSDELTLARAQAIVVYDLIKTAKELLYDADMFEDEADQRRMNSATATLSTAQFLLRQIYERSEE